LGVEGEEDTRNLPHQNHTVKGGGVENDREQGLEVVILGVANATNTGDGTRTATTGQGEIGQEVRVGCLSGGTRKKRDTDQVGGRMNMMTVIQNDVGQVLNRLLVI
jgi:hypothetical protein